MRKKLLVLVLALVFCSAVPATGEQVVDRIVAVVNGEIITLFELNQKADPVVERFRSQQPGSLTEDRIEEIKKRVLQTMVDNMLLRQEAERLEMEIEDAEVQDRIEEMKTQRGWDDERLDQMLANEGLDRSSFEKNIREDLMRRRLVGAMVRRKVVVTNEEIQTFYKDNQEQFAQEKKVDLRLLAVPSADKAKQLRQRIADGDLDFAQAARQFSQGPAAGQGGDLGWVKWADLAPQWKEVLRSTSPGSMTEPFSLQGQTAILYLEDMQKGQVQPLSAVRDRIADTLRGPKFEKQLETYLQRLRDKAVVDIRL